jgi:hypothetical protein
MMLGFSAAESDAGTSASSVQVMSTNRDISSSSGR